MIIELHLSAHKAKMETLTSLGERTDSPSSSAPRGAEVEAARDNTSPEPRLKRAVRRTGLSRAARMLYEGLSQDV